VAIAFGTTGSTSMTAGATSATVDISAATVGDWVYCWVALGLNSGAVSATGWTSLLDADEGTSAHYALLRRQRQAGDTTFSFGWTTSTKGTLGWASWSGLDGTTPDEGAALATNGSTSRTAVPTPSATPTTATRWAASAFANRTTSVGNKPITWTSDGAQTERLDVDNNAAGSAPWVGLEIADTNATVTQAAHTYTATHAPAAETHDGSAIWFLIPAAPVGVTGPRIVAGPPFTWPRVVPPFIGASLPLGNPAVRTSNVSVVSTPWVSLRPPGATLSASQPLGNPAVPTPRPLVVSAPWAAKVPGALLFGPGAPAAVVVTTGTPQPLVVTPPFTWPYIPPVNVTASQPLGNPAVGTPEPLVIGPPNVAAPIPGVRLFAAPTTIRAPAPLVSVPAFTLTPVPAAKIFAAPQTPAVVSTVATPQPMVVSRPVPAIPGNVLLTWSSPLGGVAAPFTPAYVGVDGSAYGSSLDGRATGQSTDGTSTPTGDIDGLATAGSQDGATTATGYM
jgi:hypothetical protein